jgi:hypothetical protein
VHRLRDPAEPLGFADRAGWDGFRWQDSPVALGGRPCARRRVLAYADRAEFADHNPPVVQAYLRDLGLHAVVVAPLAARGGSGGRSGVGLGPTPTAADPLELLSIATIAGFAAQALERRAGCRTGSRWCTSCSRPC